MENTPFFTVITASYNPGDALLTTVRAVLEQSFLDYEMIIKDGGSSDSSLEGLPSDGRIRTVCEPDTGIYDAMNRATELARGKYIVFMNWLVSISDERNTLRLIHPSSQDSIK